MSAPLRAPITDQHRRLAQHSRGGKGYWIHLLPPEGTQALAARRVLPRSWPLECRALAWGAAVWALAWVLTACVERPVGRWITGTGKAP